MLVLIDTPAIGRRQALSGSRIGKRYAQRRKANKD